MRSDKAPGLPDPHQKSGDVEDPEYRLLVDLKLGRPGCILLQALGAEGDYRLFLYRYTDIWLVAPTPDMKWYRGTKSDFELVFSKEWQNGVR